MAPSDNGFQQMSFVNSIATTKGGRHVEHVAKLMETALIETIKKKNKSGVQIKPHQVAYHVGIFRSVISIVPRFPQEEAVMSTFCFLQIRNHMWVFVNCLIVNPTFDSQTKEQMTLQMSQFGSKASLTDKFKTALAKSGIVESVLAWSKFKQDQQSKSKLSAKKTNKLKGIAKV